MNSIRNGAFPGSGPEPVVGEWRQGFEIRLDIRMRPRRVYDDGRFITGKLVRTFGVEERIVEVELPEGRNAYLIHSFVVPRPLIGGRL